MSNFDYESTIETRIEYSYYKGVPGQYSKSLENWLPGDPPECTQIKAYFLVRVEDLQEALQRAEKEGRLKPGGMVEIDLYGSLDKREAANIEESCFEDAGNE